MAAHRRRLPAVPAAPPEDADRAQVVAGLQRTCPGWLVIWSAWRRTFTGFACFTRQPVIVDEAQADVFLQRVREVERAACPPGPTTDFRAARRPRGCAGSSGRLSPSGV